MVQSASSKKGKRKRRLDTISDVGCQEGKRMKSRRQEKVVRDVFHVKRGKKDAWSRNLVESEKKREG